MPRGRTADLETVSAEERAKIRDQAAGDKRLEKQLLQSARRRSEREAERRELLPLGDRRPRQVGEQLTFEQEEFEAQFTDKSIREEMRWRSQTDLFYLSRDILGRDLTEHTHRPMTDFLVRKRPDRDYRALDTVKERDLLYPRTTFKTSVATVDDSIQWAINFPENRIFMFGGEASLVRDVLGVFTNTFVIQDPPSRFNRLFPEFCIPARDKYETFYNAPCRKNPKRLPEPTCMGLTMGSTLSSRHCEVMKLFDVVNNENTQTIERMMNIRRAFYTNKKLVDPEGYVENEGTRYNPNELHSERLALVGPRFKHLVRAALWAREGPNQAMLEKALRDPNVKAADFNPADFELLFPERLSFSYLMTERGPSLEAFEEWCAHYLNDPVAASGDVTFTLEEMRQATVPYDMVPRNGGVKYVWWDLAWSTKQGRDYTVGAVGLVDVQGRLWVLAIVRGRFVPSELEIRMVNTMREWMPEMTDIEDTSGARILLGNLERRCMEYRVPCRVNFAPVSNAKDAKDARVKFLQSLLVEKRLYFVNAIDCLDDLYREFCGYGKEQHDDIPDAISGIAVNHVPKLVAPVAELESRAVYDDLRERDLHDRIHGLGNYTPEPEPEPLPPPDPYALENVLGRLNG